MNLKEAPMSTILNNSKSCCFRLLVLMSLLAPIFQASANPNVTGGMGGLGPGILMGLLLLVLVIIFLGYLIYAVTRKRYQKSTLKSIQMLLLVFSAGVLLALTWHTWLNYPVDKQLIIDIPVVVLAILGLFFAINSGLKKSGKFDTDS